MGSLFEKWPDNWSPASTPIEETSSPWNTDTPSLFEKWPDSQALEREQREVTTSTEQQTVVLETEVQTSRLQEEITSPEFSLENFKVFQDIVQEYRPEIESIISEINTEIEASSDLSRDELIHKLWSISVVWEFENLWDSIDSEVQRINNLGENDDIILQIPELNPEGEQLIFVSKEDALLYLYYYKFSLYKASNFIENINTDNPVNLRYIWYTLLAYTGYNTFWSIWRGGRILFVNNTRMWAQRITSTQVAAAGSNPNAIAEAWQYEERERALDLAKEVFRWDERIIKKLDWNLAIMIIDSRIEGYENNISSNMTFEATFWRKLKNIESQRGFWSQLADIALKPKYFNSQESTIKRLRQGIEVRSQVIEYFTQGNGTRDITNIRAYLELDHDVSNSEELSRRDRLNSKIHSIESWNLAFIYGMDKERAISEIRAQLLEEVTGERPRPERVSEVFWNGEPWNRGEWFILEQNDVTKRAPFLLEINTYESIILARHIDANLRGEEYSKERVRGELISFFTTIGTAEGQNRYTYYSASSVIEKILQGESLSSAISLSESESRENLERRINKATYITESNSRFLDTVRQNIIQKLNSINSTESLRMFETQVFDHLKNESGTYREWFAEVGRNIERIIEEKRTLFTQIPPKTSTEEVPQEPAETVEERPNRETAWEIPVTNRVIIDSGKEGEIIMEEVIPKIRIEIYSRLLKMEGIDTTAGIVKSFLDSESIQTMNESDFLGSIKEITGIELERLQEISIDLKYFSPSKFPNLVHAEVNRNIASFYVKGTIDWSVTIQEIRIPLESVNTYSLQFLEELISNKPKSLGENGRYIQNLREITPNMEIISVEVTKVEQLLGIPEIARDANINARDMQVLRERASEEARREREAREREARRVRP